MGNYVHCTPQVQDLYSLYTPSQRCGLCQNFKQTTLTGKCKWSYGPSCPVDFPLNIFIHSFTRRLYKVRTNLYPPTYENVQTRLRKCPKSHLVPTDVDLGPDLQNILRFVVRLYLTFIVRSAYDDVLRVFLWISSANYEHCSQTILRFCKWIVPKKSIAFFVRFFCKFYVRRKSIVTLA